MRATTARNPQQTSRPRRALAHVRGYFGGMPRWLLATVIGLAVVGAAAGGYYVLKRRAQSQAFERQRLAQVRFNEAAQSGDWAAMDAALAEELLANPADANALARRQALSTNSAPPGDRDLPRLTLLKALRESDSASAKREAEKLLEFAPGHWLARCVLAAEALRAGDRATAEAEVARLNNPGSREAELHIGVMLQAYELHRAVGRDTKPLRDFFQGSIAPLLKSQRVQQLGPVEKLSFVEAYTLSLEPGDGTQPIPLVEAYAPARDLLASAAADAESAGGDPDWLARAARASQSLVAVSERFARRGQIRESQRDEFVAEDRARARKLWSLVLSRDPRSAEAYRNLAALAVQAGQSAEALKHLQAGLDACPDDPTLADIRGQILRQKGRGAEAARFLADEARARPRDAVWWRVAVDAARQAGRADLAIELIAESKRLRPGEGWTTVAEARLRLQGGDAAGASELLHPLGTETIAESPELLAVTTEALAAAGQVAQLAPLAAAAEARAVAQGRPELIAAYFRGLVAAPADEPRLAGAVDPLGQSLRRFPGEPQLLRALAQVQFRRAELADWSEAATATAVQPVTRYLASEPDDREAAYWIGCLRLYGEGRPEQALRDTALLARDRSAASSKELELVGEATRRAGRADEAVEILTAAANRPRPGAGVFIQLALAHHARGQAELAKATLLRAQNLPRTPREQNGYAEAARLLF